jgi:hypothetical protein
MTLQKEAEGLCRELGDRRALAYVLGNEANILRERGQLDAAMELFKEIERLFREMNDPEAILISLANQASLVGSMPGRHLLKQIVSKHNQSK